MSVHRKPVLSLLFDGYVTVYFHLSDNTTCRILNNLSFSNFMSRKATQ